MEVGLQVCVVYLVGSIMVYVTGIQRGGFGEAAAPLHQSGKAIIFRANSINFSGRSQQPKMKKCIYEKNEIH